MDESTAFAVRRKIARCGIFETLDDGLDPRQFPASNSESPISPFRTVFPEPLYPTINVRGVWNWMVSLRVLSKERTLEQAGFDEHECNYSPQWLHPDQKF